ncbi:peptide deformylase [Ornatilinea apprima]|uniref:Peptide deformylase n=1 Tax=Ornatilinea apprima TaxID=1134406 RepID=A0A0P6XF00_9CHLR|nr:peptide deformylase [Ornatilinea apprima]KPL78215.1 peptide deformylase [Ornatilinea apprima]
MTIREIALVPEPVLRRKARKLTDFGPETQKLIDDMVETMREAPGVGLAAPQIAESLQLVVVEFAEDEENEDAKPKLFVVVNPEIVKRSEETVMGIEGCLSIPGLVGDVERNESVEIKALNRHGKPIKIKARGWLARIFQHEIDHLDGVLYTDRATRVWQPKEEEEFEDV